MSCLVELVRLKSDPVPERLTVCGLPELSVIVRLPLRVPFTVGVNATFKVQAEPAAREAGQLLVCL